MLEILAASPIQANGLTVCFDKSPDIFAIARMKYPEGVHIGMYDAGQLNGFGSLGFYDALVGGQSQKVFTFYHFYLLAVSRGKGLPQMALQPFFERAKDRANFGLSLTMKGNRAVESYIGRRPAEWFPPTRVLDEWVVKSILFSLPVKNRTGYKVRRATAEDIPVMVDLLQKEHRQRDFGIVYDTGIFSVNLGQRGLIIEDYFVATDKQGFIRGVCLAWDCGAFRRTRVLQYGSAFYPTLAGYRLLSKMLTMAPFPQKGESFRELTITDYAVEARNPEIMHALLCEIYRQHHRGQYHFMNWGSCGSDPLLASAKGFWCRDIRSQLIFTSYDAEQYQLAARLPYIDIAFI
jgi:hypothetical protein